jgi:hypothetical protein
MTHDRIAAHDGHDEGIEPVILVAARRVLGFGRFGVGFLGGGGIPGKGEPERDQERADEM